MAGLMRVLGGALQGLGQGMTENGRAQRDRQLQAIEAQRQNAIRQQERGWQIADRDAQWERQDTLIADERRYNEQQSALEHSRGLIRASAGRTPPARFTGEFTAADGTLYGLTRDGTAQPIMTPDGEPLRAAPAPVEFDRYETGADGVRYGIRNGEATPISGPGGQPFMVEAPASTAPASGLPEISASDQRLINVIADRHTSTDAALRDVIDWDAVADDLERHGRPDLASIYRDADAGGAGAGDGAPLPDAAADDGDDGPGLIARGLALADRATSLPRAIRDGAVGAGLDLARGAGSAAVGAARAYGNRDQGGGDGAARASGPAADASPSMPTGPADDARVIWEDLDRQEAPEGFAPPMRVPDAVYDRARGIWLVERDDGSWGEYAPPMDAIEMAMDLIATGAFAPDAAKRDFDEFFGTGAFDRYVRPMLR